MYAPDPLPTPEQELPEHPSGFLGLVRRLGLGLFALLPLFFVSVAIVLGMLQDWSGALGMLYAAGASLLMWRRWRGKQRHERPDFTTHR